MQKGVKTSAWARVQRKARPRDIFDYTCVQNKLVDKSLYLVLGFSTHVLIGSLGVVLNDFNTIIQCLSTLCPSTFNKICHFLCQFNMLLICFVGPSCYPYPCCHEKILFEQEFERVFSSSPQ